MRGTGEKKDKNESPGSLNVDDASSGATTENLNAKVIDLGWIGKIEASD